MAIGTAQKRKTDERGLPDKVIDKQLSRVRRHIRITDLISGFMVLAAGLLIYLLLVVLVDHWVFGLGTAIRWLALIALVVGPVWFCIAKIAPAMIRGINPAFAAQTIERSEPTLKNSVVNYLLLRRERAALHERVFQAVQQQAAADVSHVAVEQTVDRSAVIKAGYLLVGVMAITAAYKILSPKDPVQTVRRIVTPWADIVRPSRVSIDDVQPGDAEVLHGSQLTVSAVIRGVKEKDQVKLLYSTEDGQLVDRELIMKLDASGLRHVVDVSPESEGVQQALAYHIVAGDTATRTYKIQVVSAPTIQVDAVEYDYPAYTRRPREVVRQQGDLKALEGTRVTIRARTNQPIHTATFHLQPTPAANANAATPVVQRSPMESRDSEAWRSFVLELAEDRRTSKQASYHLEFVNRAGQASQRPIEHRIDVVPDLAPEIEILTPQKQRLEVPLSGHQAIEVRAIDPDYGLSQVRLKGVVGNKEVLNESLLGIAAAPPGQIVTTYDFQPKRLNLAVNDQISYWAEAADNRTAVNSETPAPNVARSRTFHIVVVADPAVPREQPNDDANPQNQSEPDKQPEPNGQPNAAKKQGDNKRGDQSPQSKPNDQTQSQDPQPGNQQLQNKNGTADSKQSDAKSGGNSKNQKKQQPQSNSGGEKGQPGESGGADPSDGQNKGGSSAKPADSKPMPGQGAPGAESGGSTPQEKGGSDKKPTPGSRTDAPGQAGEPQGEGQRTEPLHDGEVFDRALKKMQGKQGSGDGPPSSGDKQTASDPSPGGEKKPQDKANDPQNKPDSQDASAKPADANQSEKGGSAGTKSESAKNAGDANADKRQGEQKNAGDKSNTGGSKSENQQGKQAAGEKGSNEKSNRSPDENAAPEKSEGDAAQGEAQPKAGEAQPKAGEGQPKGAQGNQPDKKQGAGEQKQGASGEGGKSADGAREQPEKGGEKKAPPDGGKEPGTGKNGQSGAGLNSEDKSGSSNVEKAKGEDVANSDRPKEQTDSNQTPQKQGETGASTSKKQSDSKGALSGDQSGGGKKGSGQGAKQPGNDSAGSQSSSDDGAGKSEESGKGDTSQSPGNDKSSETPTGTSGDKQGAGSGATASKSGQKSNQSSPPKNQQPPPGSPAPTSNEKQAASQGGSAGGSQPPPTGGGLPGDNPAGAPNRNTEVAPGDAANLEYAKRATDLVLEYLRDQQDNPDRELMDELGWTEEDLKAFIQRWQSLKERAVEDPNAQRQLDDTLRSLGIQPTRDTRRQGIQRTDDTRGLRESGIDSKPPPMYQDQFRAFKKGAARGK